MLFSSIAFAQEAAATAPASTPAGFDLIPLIAIFAIFYFLVIRPQSKKVKAHQELVNQLNRGDEIVTNGGIIGKITKIDGDKIVHVEIAPDVVVKVQRFAIADKLTDIKPAANSNKDKEPEKKKKKAKGN